MKVTLTNEYKRFITLAEAPAMRKIIADMKDDEYTAKDYAAIAARSISGDNIVKVLEASAEICKDDYTPENYYNENSGHIDVWVRFTAIINNGFGGIIMGGALLSGIWSISGDAEANKEIMRHWYVREFKEVR